MPRVLPASALPVPTKLGISYWVVIPSVGSHRTEFSIALLNAGAPINASTGVFLPIGRLVDEVRNEFAAKAVENNVPYLCFIDEDVLIPPHAIRQLFYRLENNPEVDVVSGVYCVKSDPPMPLVFRGDCVGPYWDWKIGEFFEATGCGMGITMIRTEVFKKMAPPWFMTQSYSEWTKDGWYNFRGTEDLYFARRAREEAGAKVYIDASIICEHIDKEGRRWGLRPDCKPLRPIEYGDKVVLNLGSGGKDAWDHFPEGKAVRVDIREEVNPDIRADVRCLPFPENHADLVYSSHTLEHFGRNEVEQVVKEWCRVLKPSGEIRLVLPDLEWAAERILDPNTTMSDWGRVYDIVYGGQNYAEDFHRIGFTSKLIHEMLEAHGIVNLQDTRLEGNIVVSGRKLDPSLPPDEQIKPTEPIGIMYRTMQ